jgi:branched-chain amino acid aminotransferase
MAERVVYINGEFVAESRATVSVFDSGFTSGLAVYEVTRTFRHALFRLDAHLDRLERSMRYARIECGLDRRQLEAASNATVERNLGSIGADDEVSLWHVVSRGERPPGTRRGATVVMFCVPVELASFARGYLEGIRLVTPATRRTPPESLDPKAKVTNKMNHEVAAAEARQTDPDCLPLMLDHAGNIAETDRANFFFVSRGKLCTSSDRTVLGGITRDTVCGLAATLGIEVAKGDFTPYDVYNAEEAFISGTSYNLMPVASLNGVSPAAGAPGPVTLRIFRAWNDMVGYDTVAQSIRHLGDNERAARIAEWERKSLGHDPRIEKR